MSNMNEKKHRHSYRYFNFGIVKIVKVCECGHYFFYKRGSELLLRNKISVEVRSGVLCINEV